MLFAIVTNGQVAVVDAINKAAANAYGAARVDMEVRAPSLADMQGLDLSAVPVVLKGGKTQAEIDAETAKAEAKKAAKAAAPATV